MASEALVYFVRTGDGPVKIGTSSDLSRRLSGLQGHHAQPLNVIRVVRGSTRVEGWLHERFSAQRLHHEWFDFHPDMLTVETPDEDGVWEVPAERAPDRTYAGIVSAFLRSYYFARKNGVRMLASDARCTQRTAENWLAGTHAPNGEKFFNLMSVHPELHRQIFAEVALRKQELEAANGATAQDARAATVAA